MHSSQNSLKIEHYVLGRTLGVGAFGKVKMAKHDITNVNVAIKIINKRKMKNSKMGTKIKREIKLLRYFNHPNIIRLYEVLDTSSDIFVVMEFAEKGELFDLIAQKGKLSEPDALDIFVQILAGIEYCHNNLVSHRDLKPENILITENFTVKIADFGLSNLMKDGKYLKTSCGSPNYAAPEVISGKLYCGTDADVWSCGVILFASLAGYLPFDEEVMADLFKKIREADYVMPNHFSPQAKDLIYNMLMPDPTKRIKFYEIHLHPWIRSKNVPFYLIMPFRLDEGRRTINQKVFERLQSFIPQISFHGLTENQVKKAIIKREDRSFVVIYELLISESQVNSQPSIKNHEEKKQDLIFNPKLSIINNYSFNRDMLKNELHKQSSYQFSPLIPIQDVQAPVYSAPAKTIVQALYTCLQQFNCLIKQKNPDYRLKCVYKHSAKMTKFNSSTDIFNDINLEEDGSNVNLVSLNFIEDEKEGKVKENKFSVREITFNIQIYRMPNNSDHMVDFQISRGHPMVFMDFCNKIITLLTLQLHPMNGK